jgi:hypothetical protein
MRIIATITAIAMLLPGVALSAWAPEHKPVDEWAGTLTVPTFDYSPEEWQPTPMPWEFESFKKIREPVQTAWCFMGWCINVVRRSKVGTSGGFSGSYHLYQPPRDRFPR